MNKKDDVEADRDTLVDMLIEEKNTIDEYASVCTNIEVGNMGNATINDDDEVCELLLKFYVYEYEVKIPKILIEANQYEATKYILEENSTR